MDSIDYKIFIPSKGRADNCKTLTMFDNIENLVLVVEPQDFESYFKLYPEHTILVLPIDNGGITFCRNYIKRFCLQNDIEQYWQIDDDISHLYKREGTKLLREDAHIVLQKCGDMFKQLEVAIGSLDFRQFAWAASKPIVYDSYCCNVVYIDSLLLKDIQYTENTKEDYDIVIQAIKNKLKVARITEYAYTTPPIGSNKGGLKEIFYDLNLDEKCVDGLIEKWGTDICEPLIRPNGRRDVKINWKNINKQKALTLF
jgi:hypothetical protein